MVNACSALGKQLTPADRPGAARTEVSEGDDPDQALLENRLLRSHDARTQLPAHADALEEQPVDGYPEPGHPDRRSEPAVALANRELDAVTLVASGLSNPRIAAALNLEVSTVKSYLDVARMPRLSGRG